MPTRPCLRRGKNRLMRTSGGAGSVDGPQDICARHTPSRHLEALARARGRASAVRARCPAQLLDAHSREQIGDCGPTLHAANIAADGDTIEEADAISIQVSRSCFMHGFIVDRASGPLTPPPVTRGGTEHDKDRCDLRHRRQG